MPRIPPHFLDCSFYAYKSEEDAKKARAAGGSGFLVFVRLAFEPWIQVYAVTNQHVLNEGCTVLRVNTRAGDVDTIKTDSAAWFRHPDNDDVVVLPLDLASEHKWLAVDIRDFATEEMVNKNTIGVGDEVFMVGRLVTREGIQQNNPVVRFGHLAMMRDAIKREYDGNRQESFLVECRSVSGFSGSPVFVKPNPDAVAHFGRIQLVPVVPPSAFLGVYLLGIDWCHIPLWKDVYQLDRKTPLRGMQMEQNTGIAGVIPAWRLAEILNREELMEQREEESERLRQQMRVEEMAITDTHESDERPFTKADFEQALKKVATKLPDSGTTQTSDD